MTIEELDRLPTPPPSDRWVERSTNGAGQEIYRVVTQSAWEVIPSR